MAQQSEIIRQSAAPAVTFRAGGVAVCASPTLPLGTSVDPGAEMVGCLPAPDDAVLLGVEGLGASTARMPRAWLDVESPRFASVRGRGYHSRTRPSYHWVTGILLGVWSCILTLEPPSPHNLPVLASRVHSQAVREYYCTGTDPTLSQPTSAYRVTASGICESLGKNIICVFNPAYQVVGNQTATEI
ncbi:hypothetical protein N431DRAFT_450478 [Stipitochalara longipes BDJ]|nr:hypothetical protein N431DRAFT_450478 [Stipitochalara longipes BDJ]